MRTWADETEDARQDAETARRREQRRAELQRDMERAMAGECEFVFHPRPWTWIIAFHEGWFIQFVDANGAAILDDSLRDPEIAANLLRNVNGKKE